MLRTFLLQVLDEAEDDLSDADDAAMYEDYNGCQRTQDDHDVDSMNEQYSYHP